jgi:hypothetical protein
MVRMGMGYYNSFQLFYAGPLQHGKQSGAGYDVTRIHEYVATVSKLDPCGRSFSDIYKVYARGAE